MLSSVHRVACVLNFVTAAVPGNEGVAVWRPGRIAGRHMRDHLEGRRPYPGAV
ncbi:hypothetical protein ACWEHT_00855 [Streptomyces sp. NPDC004646]